MKSRPIAERLREHIKPSAGCWNWVGNTQKGYGVLSVNGRPVRAHRLVLGLTLGRSVRGWVLHKCDNRLCCRPDHLYEGSRHDNVRDAIERDRFAKGEDHGGAVLTAAHVRAIRMAVAAGQTGKSQAARFGVHVMTVSDIVRRKTWTHV